MRRQLSLLEEVTIQQEVIVSGFNVDYAVGFVLSVVRTLRRTLLRQGAKIFGPPPAEIIVAVNSITDAARLQELQLRVLDAADWADLMRE